MGNFNNKKLLVSKVYIDDIQNVTIEEFYKKFVTAVKHVLLEQYEHVLTEDKCSRVANILAIRFCNRYDIVSLVKEYNNINAMVSIVNGYEYDCFNIQDEGYFLDKNQGKTTHRDIFSIPMDKIARFK